MIYVLKIWKRHPRGCLVAFARLGAASLVLAVALPSAALDIVSNLGGGSATPTFDPDASQLEAIFDAAASYWEDIVEDSATVNITYRYKDIGALATGGALLVLNGKPFAGSISVDSDPRSWYFDSDPTDHAEFLLSQLTYRDLSSSEQSAWFNGAPPDLLEVRYGGSAKLSAPSQARNGYDMFTIVLHEIGHVLGLSHMDLAGAETIGQGDFDYDVDPLLAGGTVLAVKTAGTNPANVDDWTHVATDSLICNACATTGERVLPSATDVFAVASAAGWTQIDLPRQDFLGDGDWNLAANWVGGRLPDAEDAVWIRDSHSAQLTADVEVSRLVVGEDGTIDLASHVLTVGDALTLHASEATQVALSMGAGSIVTAENALVEVGVLAINGGEATTNLLSIEPGGSVHLLDGMLAATSVDIDLDAGGQFLWSGGTFAVGQFGDDLQQEGGLLIADPSSASFAVDGDYAQNAGILQIDLAGAVEQDQYDQLQVQKSASLAGTLRVQLAETGSGPFVPTAGDVFDVLVTGEQLSGAFTDLELPQLEDGLLWTVEYADFHVRLQVMATLTGDFNLDGVVDGKDLTIWEAAFGTDGGADADEDGDSDGADFLLWQRNFGTGVNAVAANTVPEPTGSILLLFGVLGYRSSRLALR